MVKNFIISPSGDLQTSPDGENFAIRTMVIKDNQAIFNVGGGIVIDSIPENEYEESLLKAKALITALGGKLNS